MRLRIVTALILAPAVILLTLFLPTHWLSVLFLAVALTGLYEWNRLTIQSATLFSIVAIGLAIATWWLVNQPRLLFAIVAVVALFWVYQVYSLQRGTRSKTASGNVGRGASREFFLGTFCLLGAWAGLVLLHQTQQGALTTIALLVMVWTADGFAYFTGKAIGKHKLAPALSPNKTIEGVIGGLLGVCLIALLYAVLLLDFSPRWSVWLIASVSIGVFSVVGDLYESRLKRLAGVKDSGHLLPGHGGILDRIDGLIAATPVFVTLILMRSEPWL